MREIKYIVIHCTAGGQDQKTETIKAYWKGKGWKSPGYHILISKDGTFERLAEDSAITNGVKGHNANSIHICYKGGVKDKKPFDNRTDSQKITLRDLVEQYMKKYPNAKVLGHRDFSPDKNRNGIVEENEWYKACPSFSVTQWLKDNGLN